MYEFLVCILLVLCFFLLCLKPLTLYVYGTPSESLDKLHRVLASGFKCPAYVP